MSQKDEIVEQRNVFVQLKWKLPGGWEMRWKDRLGLDYESFEKLGLEFLACFYPR